MSDLRKNFWSNIYEMAKKDKKIIVLVGDLGFSFYEEFQKDLPKQFINCGIAEQNMIGCAVGLSYQGFKPYVYSNALFLLSRAHEQVRDDMCYNNANVKLIGTGAAGFLGFTHNMDPVNEDKLLINHLPNIKLFFPKSDKVLKKALSIKGPVYIKI